MQQSLLISSVLFLVAVTAGLFATRSANALDWGKLELTDQFYSEGSAVGDINGDGNPDLVYGPFWWEGPTFDKSHRFASGEAFDGLKGYSDNFFSFVEDIDADGDLDVVVFGFPGEAVRLYENPSDRSELWPMHLIADQLGHEAPDFIDLIPGGLPEIVGSRDGRYGFYEAGEDPKAPWKWVAVSPPKRAAPKFGHGMGVGDLNGDGRLDIIEKTHVYFQPEALGGKLWHEEKWAALPYGAGGAQILVDDVDQDGDSDIITSLNGHSWGIAWFEQFRPGKFKRHDIIGRTPADNPQGVSFSQPHGMALADIDGDGRNDFVSGKRWMAHKGKDPGAFDDPVVYWFRNTATEEGIEFVPVPIDDSSGVGVCVTVADLNSDSLLDVVSANKRGLAVHLQSRLVSDEGLSNQWELSGAEIRFEGNAVSIQTEKGGDARVQYTEAVEDFELSFRLQAGVNSGLEIRLTDGEGVGYKIPLSGQVSNSGSIVDLVTGKILAEAGALTVSNGAEAPAVLPFGEVIPERLQVISAGSWNSIQLKRDDTRIELHINGNHQFAFEAGLSERLFDAKQLSLHLTAPGSQVMLKGLALEHSAFLDMTARRRLMFPDAQQEGIIPADAPNIGFELGTLEGWTASEGYAGDEPSTYDFKEGTGKVHYFGQSGTYPGDKTRGTLTSDPFEVTHPWATVSIGAYYHLSTRLEILSAKDGEVLAKLGGAGSWEMVTRLIDLRDHVGEEISIRIVDDRVDGWGSLLYDDFRFHEQAPDLPELARLRTSPILRHLQRNPNQTDPIPAIREIQVPQGFEVKTIAAEPEVVQPIAFAFDHRGRIWIAEAIEYPIRSEQGPGKDRVIILEDTDKDGSFETRKVFADGLHLLSGIELGYGGVYLASAPELLFIPDRDGDDVPDGPAQVLLDGFDTRDTHETPNALMWGYDGWLYGCHGIFNFSHVGKPGTPKEDRVYLQAGIWRMDPVTHEFEIYAHGGSNQWGAAFNEKGDMFMTHCRSSWGLGPVTQVLRDGHYWTQNNDNHRDFIASVVPGMVRKEIGENNFFTSIATYGHGEGGAGASGTKSIFGGHSHVGAMIYLGDNWPKEYRGNLFTPNLHGSQLNREILTPADSAYVSHSYGRDTYFSPDPEFLPVQIKYGPDGAVYFSDWADRQQCHNKSEEIWDRSNGRLYRMAWTATDRVADPRLDQYNSRELLSFLTHENEWYPHMAQHLIRQRRVAGEDQTSLVDGIRELVADQDYSYRIRAMAMLDAIGGFSMPLYQRLLEDPDEHIVKLALHYLLDRNPLQNVDLGNQLVRLAEETDSPIVRLHLALASQYRIPEPFARSIVEILAMKQDDAEDRFIGKAVWFAYSKYAREDREDALKLAHATPLPSLRRSIIWAHSQGDLRGAITSASQFESPQEAGEAVSMILQQHTRRRKLEEPPEWSALSAKVAEVESRVFDRHVAELNRRFSGQAAAARKLPSTGKPIGGAREVVLTTAHGLLFAEKLLEVKPGEALRWIFRNKDAIPHNAVLAKPGTLEQVGLAADAMVTDPEALAKHYVPEMTEVIAYFPVINGGQAHVLNMRAPEEPGDYPYICTFPGHWRVMHGVLRVSGSADPVGKKISALSEGAIRIEGESLVSGAEATSGEVVVQGMDRYLDEWSSGRQLWWKGASPGDTLQLAASDLSPGSYEVVLHMTRATDYAIATLQIGDRNREVDFYHTAVAQAAPERFPNVKVGDDGTLAIGIGLKGKNSASRPNYMIGIDRIELVPSQ